MSCTIDFGLKNNGVMMRLGKPVGDLLVAYEMKLVDLENQLQALAIA